MGRNNRARKTKKKLTTKEQLDELLRKLSKELGQTLICITEEEVEAIKQDAIKTTLDCASSLLEYNMILENHLSPEDAKRQGKLMDIRAQAIVDGNLTWEEIDAFLDEHYAKEEEKDAKKAGEEMA